MNPLLIIDTNYMCQRNFHAMGYMNEEEPGLPAIYGVLRDIVSLQSEFATVRMAFAFDAPSAKKHRYEILPGYKSSRRERYAEESQSEKDKRRNLRDWIKKLAREILPAIGFNNIFYHKMLEADDIIASIAGNVPDDDEAYIIASDQDLWQCIRHNVHCHNPTTHKTYTEEAFVEQWGIKPDQWAKVKAYAGCSTDDVPGLPGVGEKTVVKWLLGNLGAHTKAHQKITSDAARALYMKNMDIVQLPYAGTPIYDIVPDEVTEDKWNAIADELGMGSLLGNPPKGARKSRGRSAKKRKKGFGI